MLALSAMPAWAQQGPQPSMAERNFGVAIQQIVPAATLYAEDMARRLAERDARIAELERLCGEACRVKDKRD